MFLSWSESDQDKAIAYNMSKGDVCPKCGTREEDWVDEDGFPLEEPIYQPVAHICHGCAETSRFSKTIPDNARDSATTILVTHEEFLEKYSQDSPANRAN